MKRKGFFITLEGLDGCGKTTISKALYQHLDQMQIPVIYTREPGGIEIAEEIRKIILNKDYVAMDNRCEALLYAACRRQHLIEKIIPMLNKGYVVICDRFIDSSLAYQGIARNIGIQEILSINEFAIEGYYPDLTLYLSVDLEEAKRRSAKRKEMDRIELEGNDFFKEVYNGYEYCVEKYPGRICKIDASLDVELVKQTCIRKVLELINE